MDIRDTNEFHRKGKKIKADYDRLHRLATNQPVGSLFSEPKVEDTCRSHRPPDILTV